MMNTARLKIDRSSLRERMQRTQLPVLPPGTPYLLKAMADDDIGFRELSSIVEKFPSIAARLIFLANSTWSSPAVEVTSIEMACARLGFFVVRSVSVALSIASIFDARRCPAFDQTRYWADALLTADIAATLDGEAGLEEAIDVQSARTAGLLHNLGLLWQATWMPEETHRALSLADGEETGAPGIDSLLEEECGIGFCEAGALLAEAWKFSPLLIDALRYQQETGYADHHWEAANLIGVARLLIRSREEDATGLCPDPRIERLGITPDCQQQILERIDSRSQEIRELARTLFSA